MKGKEIKRSQYVIQRKQYLTIRVSAPKNVGNLQLGQHYAVCQRRTPAWSTERPLKLKVRHCKMTREAAKTVGVMLVVAAEGAVHW